MPLSLRSKLSFCIFLPVYLYRYHHLVSTGTSGYQYHLLGGSSTKVHWSWSTDTRNMTSRVPVWYKYLLYLGIGTSSDFLQLFGHLVSTLLSLISGLLRYSPWLVQVLILPWNSCKPLFITYYLQSPKPTPCLRYHEITEELTTLTFQLMELNCKIIIKCGTITHSTGFVWSRGRIKNQKKAIE